MAEPAAVKIVVTGLVQGVMFRDFTRLQAQALGLTGYVRNLPGGRSVEIEANGERRQLDKLLLQVKRGPPRAVVESVLVEWHQYSGKYPEFRVQY